MPDLIPPILEPFDPGQFSAVLLDLDGTVYHEEHPLPGAVDLIRKLQREGRTYACLTNSTSSPERLSQRLNRMGVDVDPAHIYTAAAAACDYVVERFGGMSVVETTRGGAAGLRPLGSETSLPVPHPTPPRIYNLSTEGVQEMLDGKVHWVQEMHEPCDAVICGVPLNVFATEERQRTALMLLRKGAALVGICADRVYPSPRGLEFGVGAMAAMMAYASNTVPVFCGKPEALFFRELCHRLGVDPAGCVLVGDNLESDIAGGKGVGMRTILILGGVSSREDALRLPRERQPDWIINDLRDLC